MQISAHDTAIVRTVFQWKNTVFNLLITVLKYLGIKLFKQKKSIRIINQLSAA